MCCPSLAILFAHQFCDNSKVLATTMAASPGCNTVTHHHYHSLRFSVVYTLRSPSHNLLAHLLAWNHKVTWQPRFWFWFFRTYCCDVGKLTTFVRFFWALVVGTALCVTVITCLLLAPSTASRLSHFVQRWVPLWLCVSVQWAFILSAAAWLEGCFTHLH